MNKQKISTTFWRKSKSRTATEYNLRCSVFNKKIMRNAKKLENMTHTLRCRGWGKGEQPLEILEVAFGSERIRRSYCKYDQRIKGKQDNNKSTNRKFQ